MMADCGLALAQLRAKRADVALTVGKDQDDLEAGRVADVLEQDRRAASLMKPLLCCPEALGLARDHLGGRALDAGLRCHRICPPQTWFIVARERSSDPHSCAGIGGK